jgi:hypothetical protein
MKEDDEGIRFHTLLTAGMHRGGRISPEKRRRWVCSWVVALFVAAACRGERAGGDGGPQGKARRGSRRGNARQ